MRYGQRPSTTGTATSHRGPTRHGIHRSALLVAAIVVSVSGVLMPAPAAAERQSGVQDTPDNAHVLVNKDFGTDRFAITLNVADGTVTGNVFSTADGSAKFLYCEQSSPNVFDCQAADACTTDNRQSGIQRTPDNKRILVNKDYQGQRFAITLNVADGTATGNVFKGDGAPSFIFCTPIPGNKFSCTGADTCTTQTCIDQYRFISDQIELPGDFFDVPETCGPFAFFSTVKDLPPSFFVASATADCTVTPPSAGCVGVQAQQAVDRAHGVLDVGVAVVGGSGSSSLSAAATTSCPDGGSSTDNGNGFTDVDCKDLTKGIVSNGTVVVDASSNGQQFHVTFQDFSVRLLSTGETLLTRGTLIFTVGASTFTVTGANLFRSSNFLGEFTDVFSNVVVGDDGSFQKGTVTTTVTNGKGAYSHVRTVTTSVLGPQLAIVVTTLDVQSDPVISIVAPDSLGLCNPCVLSTDCSAPLVCRQCSSGDCADQPKRCTVKFTTSFGQITASCSGGFF